MELKKRIVALDIGTKRIGVAVCDALWLGATPVKLIQRKNDKQAEAINNEMLREQILNSIKDFRVENLRAKSLELCKEFPLYGDM